ncbi:MAG TPA: plastocyanin/azurin family copper-binding protein [Herpetosiphonaceae bacterium]|nr:plastocyanin/azurin family copper-binding protein [Herpetosiphonaceae bacterium]
MKNVIRLGTRLSTAMLLTTLLISCGAATTPASNGPAPTAQQAAGLEQTTPSPVLPTMTSTATSIQLEPTMAPTDEPEPTQTPAATGSPVVPPTATVSAPSATVSAPTPTEHAHQPAPGATVQADIKLFQYQPDPLEIAVGTTVMWTNKDVAPHTVTHGTYVKRGGAFDSGTLSQGQSFAFTFDRADNYTYTCLIHPEMVGTIKVVGP